MNRKSVASLMATTAVSMGLLLAGGGPAMAAESDAAAKPDSAQNSCWVDLSTNESLCVDEGVDLVREVREKKGVELIVPDGTVIAGFEVNNTYSSQRGDVTTQAAVVVGILYDNINYGGGTFVASTDQGCAGGWVYTYNSLSPYGWNDRASSYKGFSNCRSTVFEGENQSGSQNGPSFNASSLGAMNDKASSYRLAL